MRRNNCKQMRRNKCKSYFSVDRLKSPHAGPRLVVDPSANSDTQGRPDTYAYVVPAIVPVIVPVLVLPIVNLSQIAVVCRIDLYRRGLWHGLAWRWHSKNDTSRNGRGHG